MKGVITIRRAKPADAKMISNIGRSVKVAGKIKREHIRRGFLRGDVSVKFYLRAIKNSTYFFVAVRKKRAVGFLMGYSTSFILPDNYFQGYVLRHYPSKAVFIDQIAVLPAMQGRSIGRKMCEALFKKAKGMKVISASWASPHNRATEKFHLRLGFRKVKTLKGISRGKRTAAFIWLNKNRT